MRKRRRKASLSSCYSRKSSISSESTSEEEHVDGEILKVQKLITAAPLMYNYWTWKVERNHESNTVYINGKSAGELLKPGENLHPFLPIDLSMLGNNNIDEDLCIMRGGSYRENPFSRLVSRLKSLKWSFTRTQSIALSSFFSGCNTMLKAGPGTGKTLAYIIAAIFHCVKREDKYIEEHSYENYKSLSEGYGSLPEAIVLVPNTELANQVHQLAKDIVSKSGYSRLNPTICTGDMKKINMEQIADGSRFIIGIPASFIHYSQGSTTSTHYIRLNNVSLVICDEYRVIVNNCSNLLSSIIGMVKQDAQLIFVGTNGYNRVDNLVPIDEKAKSFLHSKVNSFREIVVEDESNNFISHHYHIFEDSEEKETWLVEFLMSNSRSPYSLSYSEVIRGKNKKVTTYPATGKCIIHANDQAMVKRIGHLLDMKGFRNVAQSHGGMSKTRKNVALEDFKEKRSKTKILIATFNSSKGQDYGIEPMFVINYAAPVNIQAYADAAGRNGRHGTGCVITLFSPGHDARFAQSLSEILETELNHKDNTDWIPLRKWGDKYRKTKLNPIDIML